MCMILETAVQGDKLTQSLESESLLIGADHSQKVKAAPIKNDYGSRDCVNLSPSTAVSRMKRTAAILGAISLLLVSSCVKNSVTGERELTVISRTQEVQIGQNAFQTAQQAQGGPYVVDSDLANYVRQVGHRVARQSARSDLPYEFIIVNDSTPNAWTLPGGKIAINRGLLVELQSEAELAAVLGHEIVHAAARHGAKGIERGILLQSGIIALGVATQQKQYNDILVGSANVGAMLLHTKYGRGHELEADRYGMIYMAKAGYNPQAAVSLQELFLKLSKRKTSWIEGLFASHPPSEERIVANKKTLLEVQGPDCIFDGTDEYAAAIKQLISQKTAYQAYDDGVTALSEKSYKKAANLAEKSLEQFPDEALFWHLKGQTELYQRKPKLALSSFSEAIARNPNYFDFYLKRAEAKNLLGDYSGARADAKKSNDLLPTGEANELLGRLWLKCKNPEKAYAHFAIAAHADSPAGERARYYLKKLN